MIPGQGWTPPPGPPPPPGFPPQPGAPPPPPRRYATKGIWIGIVLGVIATIALSGAAIAIGVASNDAAVGWVLFLIAVSLPLVAGILLAAREGSPSRRGLGLGLIIGWALAPIVFGGACVLIILGAYTVPGFPGGVA